MLRDKSKLRFKRKRLSLSFYDKKMIIRGTKLPYPLIGEGYDNTVRRSPYVGGPGKFV